MKYEPQVNEILEKFFSEMDEPWMSEEEKRQFRGETLKEMGKQGITKETIDLELQEGVKNGHSIEQQMSIILEIFFNN